jgi:regulatory protein
MTSPDDLAPVTPLFGRRGVARPVGGDASEADRASSAEAEQHGGAAPQDAWVTDASAVDVSDDPVAGAAESASGVEETPVGARRPTSRSSAAVIVPDESDGSAEPADAVEATAAALAAISDHWSGPRAVEPLESSMDEDDEDDEGEPEDLEAQRSRAENVSMHALSRRGVSSSEMASLLASRDLDAQVVSDEVERLEGVGLLNDRELAENLVRAKQERKGLGRGAVTSELRSRGIAPELIEQAMSEIDDDDEQARADEWARKRSSSLQGLDRATAERRLNGYLMRRGYRSETIRRAVEKALPRGGGSRGGVRFQ